MGLHEATGKPATLRVAQQPRLTTRLSQGHGRERWLLDLPLPDPRNPTAWVGIATAVLDQHGSFAARGGFGSNIERKLVARGMAVKDIRRLLGWS
jgi:hypothetical protein